MGSLRDKVYEDLVTIPGIADIRWKHNSPDYGLLLFKKDDQKFCINFERVIEPLFYYDWIEGYWAIFPFKPTYFIDEIRNITDILFPLLEEYDFKVLTPNFNDLAEELKLNCDYDDELSAEEAAEDIVNLYFQKNPLENDEKGFTRAVLESLCFQYLYCTWPDDIDLDRVIKDRDRHKRRHKAGKEKERRNKRRRKK